MTPRQRAHYDAEMVKAPKLLRRMPDLKRCNGCREVVPVRSSIAAAWCSGRCLQKFHPDYVDTAVAARACSRCQRCERFCGEDEMRRFVLANPFSREMDFVMYRRTLPLGHCVQTLPGRYCLETVYFFCSWCAHGLTKFPRPEV